MRAASRERRCLCPDEYLRFGIGKHAEVDGNGPVVPAAQVIECPDAEAEELAPPR